ncbi:hypothetical protein I4U23_021085 [Adineta vaga]|nr:hypothetical protein I4U23_021085 [Adineta vaga]
MLQDYRRQIKIRPFTAKSNDRTSKQLNSNLSIVTDISLLSISSSSKSNDNKNEIDYDSSSSEESVSIATIDEDEDEDEDEEHKVQQNGLDSYIFNKHLNRIPSTISRLRKTDIDQSIYDLFNDNKSIKSCEMDDYNPCSIQGPPFAEYLDQLRRSKMAIKPPSRPSAFIPVRTTRAEQLKLARQRSAINNASNQYTMNAFPKVSQQKPSPNVPKQQSPIPTTSRMSRPTTSGHNGSYRRAKSAQLCQTALSSNRPLRFSALLLKQIQQDIQNEEAQYPPITCALLHEHSNAPLNHRYKMKRIHRWLEKLIPKDYLEYNEYASNQSTLSTNFSDRLNDEYGFLSDDKYIVGSDRTYAEAHRLLPIFQSEVRRKIQQCNFLSSRLQLDLYTM